MHGQLGPLAAAPLGSQAHPVMVLPFVLLLAAIAIAPLAAKHAWERFYHWIAASLGALTLLYYLAVLREPAPMIHTAIEYLGFLSLVGSLFVVTGGIHIRVKGEATPAVNCLYLILGALLSNVIGTTGASMLLIRPWIRMNRYRITSHHVVYFIFIISNVGGCLSPVGDPPLFLGFLKGVPFFWVLQHCWGAWLTAVLLLTALFYVTDRRNFLRAPEAIRLKETAHEEWHFSGLHNIGFIAMILAAVFLPFGCREGLMVLAAAGSWMTTSKAVHKANAFTLDPVKEVAWLFAGIFLTMVPALSFLELHAAQLGLRSPTQFYWLTGALSAVLDNAPTYLAFLAAAFGVAGLDINNPADMMAFIASHSHLLRAISLGAVFFGAMTYIGNGPNFMVKAIAEHAKVETPGFLEYLLRHALPILLPVLLLISLSLS